MNASPVWLRTTWEGLLRRHAQHTLPHALLLVGSKGIGKKEISFAFAQVLLCQTQSACGECHACTLFVCNHHPDFFMVAPQEHGQIKIDQIREVIESLTKTAQQGGYRVVVIQDAHAMNTAAANALLKTLEEPGDRTLLMLLTDREAFISATLRSRCQVLKVEVDEEAALDWLQTQNLSEDAAHSFLALSENAPFLAAQLAQSNYVAERAAIFKKIKQVVSGELSAVAATQDLLDKPLDEILLSFQMAFMDLIRVKTGFKSDAALSGLCEQFSLARLFAHYDFMLGLRRQINSRLNLNATLLLENLFLNLQGR